MTILCGLMPNGRFLEAKRLFDEMPRRNAVSGNAMIAGHITNCQMDDGIGMFMEMPERDFVSWTTVINGYIRIDNLDEARDLLEQILKKHCSPNNNDKRQQQWHMDAWKIREWIEPGN